MTIKTTPTSLEYAYTSMFAPAGAGLLALVCFYQAVGAQGGFATLVLFISFLLCGVAGAYFWEQVTVQMDPRGDSVVLRRAAFRSKEFRQFKLSELTAVELERSREASFRGVLRFSEQAVPLTLAFSNSAVASKTVTEIHDWLRSQGLDVELDLS